MLAKIRNKILTGKRLTEADALRLFQSDDIFSLGELASLVAERKNGRKAYFIRNRHINPTNICVNRCRFCAFSRSMGQEGAYELTIAEIVKKLKGEKATAKIPYREVHIVGGLHPEWPFAYYLDLVSTIKKNFPALHIKAFTAVEIDHFSKISGLSLEETLKSLKRCGLGSMPGGGAEIFAPEIRNKLCPDKISGDRWLKVMTAAHKVGLRTNATMLYGHIESYEDRIDHLMKLRKLQDKTDGFQAFIPLAYHPKNTDMQGSYTSGIDDLKTIAISRLYLDNFQHIKAYWVMLGEKISQLALKFGADDIDGTIIEEKITHAAGGLTAEQLTAGQLIHMIRKAGRLPVERDSFYRRVRTTV
jgi:aminodeoxyfutalosine synthase